MATHRGATSVLARIVCLNPPLEPCEGQPVVFGLQDKAYALYPGIERPDSGLTFSCTLEAKPVEGSDRPNWLGPLTHGTPAARFLYLSLRLEHGEPTAWIRRIKVQLGGITWAQVEAATQSGFLLEATIDAGRSGTVRIPGGWQVVAADK